MSTAYSDGYHAGLVNERECPHLMFSFAWWQWHLGNATGLDVHCAVVEAVYLHAPE